MQIIVYTEVQDEYMYLSFAIEQEIKYIKLLRILWDKLA